ncbi:MAG: FkbM family methyltransferase [Proteobacteria bacterium]|nr:FkbM family methyltransferase [Pseudomonadota bacterium]
MLYAKRSYLKESGYLESAINYKPIRRDGSPLPWMNYSIISFLEQRLSKDLSLFEYGSGNSTLFFSNLVSSVVSVECNREWYEYVVESMPENVKLILCDPFDSETYSKIIQQQERKFDVVVVDGEDRVNCLINAQGCLTEKGVMILDDSKGEGWHSVIDQLQKQGFKKLDFEGLKPGRTSGYRTTIFYKNENCMGI